EVLYAQVNKSKNKENNWGEQEKIPKSLVAGKGKKGKKNGIPQKMNALQEGQGNNPYVNVEDDNAKDDPYSEVQIPHIKDNTFKGRNRNMFASTGIAGTKKDPP
ncbi:hypothetical protein LSH36_1290g00029, partial [Paralvinella palmiformis]